MHNQQEPQAGLSTPAAVYPWTATKDELAFALLVALSVLVAALLGIFTRPIGLLAAFWPANAVFLGLLLSNPGVRSRFAWIAAPIAYIVADQLMGGQLLITFWMTLANLAGAATGFGLYQRLPDQERVLGRPLSVLIMFCICAFSAVVAAIIGAGSAWVLLDQEFRHGFEFWFTGELVNYLAILPVILTFSTRKSEAARVTEQYTVTQSKVGRVAPLATLAFSLAVGAAFGGPGAISFAVPALLWCALSYTLFFTSLCTLFFCAWMLIATSSGVMDGPLADDALRYTSSARLGVALISIVPLAAAAINTSRLSLVAKLAQAAHYDFLTGVLARGEFIKRSRGVLKRSAYDGQPVAVLMLDIDRFKRINDMHGHCIGDKALCAFTQTVISALRTEELFGRIGGEEFGIVIPGQNSEQAFATAERIRQVVAQRCASLVGQTDGVTVSIGLTSTDRHPGESLEGLLRLADQALYSAKRDGRDRVAQA